jgi:uncharacterized membrane protein
MILETFGLASCAAATCISLFIGTKGPVGLPGCAGQSACEAVATSRWSRWGPIPVTFVGATCFFLLSVVLAIEGFGQISLALALAVAGAGVWFILLQLIVLRRMCLYCNVVHVLGFSVLGLVLFKTLGEATPSAIGREHAWLMPAIIASLVLIALIGGQLVLTPKMYRVEQVTPELENASLGHGIVTVGDAPTLPAPVPVAINEQKAPEVSERFVSLLGGRVRLNCGDWPSVGPRDSAHWIGLIFDYTCPVCRKTHESIRAALAEVDEAIGVMILPVPTHPACNSTIKQMLPGHGQACEYARLAISVWQSRPERFEEFDRFMFSQNNTPPLGVAIAKAQELAGVHIDPHHPSKEIDGVIHRAVEVYRAVDKIKIPILMLPRASVVGEINSSRDLHRLLGRELKLQSAEQAAKMLA